MAPCLKLSFVELSFVRADTLDSIKSEKFAVMLECISYYKPHY